MCAEEARPLGEIEREIQREQRVYKEAFVSVHSQTNFCSKGFDKRCRKW
jgi:hypothetical protein